MRRSRIVFIVLLMGGIVAALLITRGPGDEGKDDKDSLSTRSDPATVSDTSSDTSPGVGLQSWAVKNVHTVIPDPRPENVKPKREGYHNSFQINFHPPEPKSVLLLTILRNDILMFSFFTEGEMSGTRGHDYYEISSPRNGIYTLDLYTAGEITDVTSVFELRAK